MSFCGLSTPQSMPLFSKPFHAHRPPPPLTSRFRASADVPDFLSADCAEEAVQCQLDALMFNDQPRPDYGIEVMYRFAGFDPFERSTYFGPFFDLGQADFPPFDLSSVAWTQGKEDLEQFAGGGVHGEWAGYGALWEVMVGNELANELPRDHQRSLFEMNSSRENVMSHLDESSPLATNYKNPSNFMWGYGVAWVSMITNSEGVASPYSQPRLA
ncbi:hypothetical protein TEA_025402 [Camellia sinensis var. sinensis]|uniref:Uncharacterized protein n=1 Tax=Camellia sinensis var. sinensis TaxID=542762 RepID=A0A4S4DM76_CAMSN|nr:hypothetical protein TEA_025402 [Camellia sinensis var. sinensis]